VARLIDTSGARLAADNMRVRVLKYHMRSINVLNKTWHYAATELENQMKVEAPWTDRTGNARSGLFCVVTKTASADKTEPQELEMVLGYGENTPYGIYLETRKKRKARRPIVIPKLKKNNVFRTMVAVFYR
jgi:hypothetical protein